MSKDRLSQSLPYYSFILTLNDYDGFMSSLIVIVLFGLGFAYFATQNTAGVNVNLINNILTIPLYVVVLGSLLIGLLIAGVISVINSIMSSLALYSKEHIIKQREQTVEDLSKRIQDLELENAKLKGKNEEQKSPSLFKKLRHNLST